MWSIDALRRLGAAGEAKKPWRSTLGRSAAGERGASSKGVTWETQHSRSESERRGSETCSSRPGLPRPGPISACSFRSSKTFHTLDATMGMWMLAGPSDWHASRRQAKPKDLAADRSKWGAASCPLCLTLSKSRGSFSGTTCVRESRSKARKVKKRGCRWTHWLGLVAL